MLVCVCNYISEQELKDWVDLGGQSLEQVQADLGLGTCCGKCRDCARTMISSKLAQRHPTTSLQDI